jgi:diguanylate cyclase (GGDEF)-like protein
LAALDAVRQSRLLQTFALAAQELRDSGDLSVSLPKLAEQIGRATGVDRAHIVLLERRAGKIRIRQHSLWAEPGLPNAPKLAHGELPGELELTSWTARLARGETIVEHARDFDPAAREFFKPRGVQSVLCVPIFVDGEWLGVIGLDDCHGERDWSAAEIDTVQAVAELVGAGLARTAHLQSLADANRIVENSATVLFRLRPLPPYDLVYVSQNVRRYGHDPDQLLADPARWLKLIDAEAHPAILADVKAVAAGGAEGTRVELRMQTANGDNWFESRRYAVRDEQGRIVAIEGILTDINERKRAETALAFSHSLLNTTIENSPDGMVVVDANNRIMKFNRRFVELWRIPSEVVLAGDDSAVVKAGAANVKNPGEFVERVNYLYQHPEIQSHDEVEMADGRFLDRHSCSLYDSQQKYLGRVWFFRDITESKRATEKIATLARTDALTGLANRSAFLERLNLEFALARSGGHQFAVHTLDLDRFKEVNDTFGHPIGDALLREVAERMRACVRKTDMVARFGGDEFAVVQTEVLGSSDIETLATKLNEALARPYKLGGNPVTTSASIGIAPYHSDIPDVDAIMAKADLALYRAKNEGRGRFRFHAAELDEQTRHRMAIGEELRRAV